MKKNLTFFSFLCGILLYAFSSTAQMDNLTNMSAEWMRMCVRNAATDAVDIAVYNPAGLVKLPDGFQFNLSNQTLIRKPQHSFNLNLGKGDQTFKQEGIDPFLPNLYLAYKKDKWALYGGVYVAGGGATANYPDGSLTTELIALQILGDPSNYYMDVNGMLYQVYTDTKEQSLKASSYFLTYSLGGAYALTEKLSFSLGARYLSGMNKVKAGLTLIGGMPFGQADKEMKIDYKETAGGIGGIIGVNYQVCEKLNLSVHYETAVKLDFETKVNADSLGFVINGEKNRRDLPAVLYLGAGYQITPKLKTLIDFNYYFQKAANWGEDTIWDAVQHLHVEKWADLAGDCYTAGIGFIYKPCEKGELSIGAVYTSFLFKNKEFYYSKLGEFEAPKSNNLNIGLGFGCEFMPKMKLNVALGTTLWKKFDIGSVNAAALIGYPQYANINPQVTVKNSAYTATIGLNIGL